MVEGARLESVYTATYRGFESLLLRQILLRGPEGPFAHFAALQSPFRRIKQINVLGRAKSKTFLLGKAIDP